MQERPPENEKAPSFDGAFSDESCATGYWSSLFLFFRASQRT